MLDEAQLMADADRGHSWTKAVLGLKAREIHVCTSPAAVEVLKHLIMLCQDTWEEHYYEMCIRDRQYVEGSDWLMHEAFCLYAQADQFRPYEKHHSTVREACELAQQIDVYKRQVLRRSTNECDSYSEPDPGLWIRKRNF